MPVSCRSLLLCTTLMASNLASLDARADDARPEILIMDLQHSEDVKPDVARTLSELVTAEISSRDTVRTMAGSDIRNMLALEGEKQAMGCDVDASCFAEVANAMGARFVVFGRVSTLGGLIILTLNLNDAERSTALSRATVQASSLDKIVPELPGAVEKLLQKPLELYAKERAEREAKTAVVAAESEAERKAAMEQAAAASAEAEKARTTTDVAMVEAPKDPPPAPAEAEGGIAGTILLLSGGAVAAGGAVGGALVLAAGMLGSSMAATATDDAGDLQPKESREAGRMLVWAVTGGGVIVTVVVGVVGLALAGGSFFVE